VIDTLGGYRLLRTIGVGPRAEVVLAHPLRDVPDAVPAVIKIYGSAVSDESIIAEAEALERAAGEHVMRVLDVMSTDDGAPALVLSRHAAGSVTRLLADRAELQPGEAITILAPVAAAVARMHAAGVAHGALAPGSVLFDASGSPTIGCFGRATLFAPGLPAAALEIEQVVLDDVLGFGELAAAVLERAGAVALARRVRTDVAPGPWLTTFADSLFDLAEPLPVDLRPRVEAEPLPLPGRLVGTTLAPPELDAPIVPRWRSRVAEVVASLRAVRRPVWVAAAVSVAAGIAALALATGAGPPAGPTPTPSAPTTSTSVPPDPGPVGGDDPVAAALVLLQVRELCIRDLSIGCLDDVGQPGSAALEADRELVTAMLDGAESGPLPIVNGASLTQRLGDSALVALGPDSEPASVLLVKGEAGWRIRDYLTG